MYLSVKKITKYIKITPAYREGSGINASNFLYKIKNIFK